MRLDKFFKVSRVIKRRPVAKKVLDNKKVKVNGKVAKAGLEIKVKDIIELEYFNRYIKLEVLEVPSGNVSKEMADTLINILETKRIEPTEAEKEFSKEDIFGWLEWKRLLKQMQR